MSRAVLRVLLCVVTLTVSCGDSEECSGESCGNAAPDAGGSAPLTGSLLSAAASSYSEAEEASNGSASGAETTSYTLETENGLAIHGSFEANAATPDVYRFHSGAQGALGTPGFPGVDVQLVVDGRPLRDNTPLSLVLDTVVERGFSSLSGGTYFSNAALLRGQEYVITVAPFAPGKRYTLELRGHAVTR